MEASEYIKESEHAARQLFAGKEYYKKLIRKIPNPIFVSDSLFQNENLYNEAFLNWHKNNENAIEEARAKVSKYIGLSFSHATLCGSILQIASMAIELFSQNKNVPQSCLGFVNSEQKAAKFCIGREVRGLPIGIVIYAARNQYSHWDAPSPHRITKNVFDALTLGHDYGAFKDPAFDISNPRLGIYSHNILALLGWDAYEDYDADIRKLILPSQYKIKC